MTVRTAELMMAILMAVFSGYLMWKSTELNIGWVPDEGPGGGTWPFWLATVMLVSCLWMIVNWVRKTSPPSRSNERYFLPGVLWDVGLVAAALTITVALFSSAGAYLALALFMAFYVGFLGGHSVFKTVLFSVLTPVVTFIFFELILKIILPKGFTEPFFLPIFKYFGMAGL